MLALTRHRNESVIIAGNIKVTVVSIDRDRVVLGFDAPRNVTILREELLAYENQEWDADALARLLAAVEAEG